MPSFRSFPVVSVGLFLAFPFLVAGCGGGSSSSGTGGSGGSGVGGNTAPTPAITTISPTSVIAGTNALTLTVNGSGFISSSVVQVGGIAEPTTYVGASQLTAAVPASQIIKGANLAVAVVNGTTTSSGAAVNLEVDNPDPAIASLSPGSEIAGTTSATVVVTGTGFDPSTVIEVNGSARPTTYTNNTEVEAVLTSADLASAGSLSLTAVSPTPGGGTSTALPFAIVASSPGVTVPAITSISPGGVPLSTSAQLTIEGTGFSQNSTVEFDGSSIASTYVNSGEITIQIAGSQVPLPGNHTITVTTPDAGTSNAETMTAYIAIQTNAMAQNPANGLLYVSVPGSAGPPYADSVVSVDPATGALGTPIYVGSEPDKLAISSDGTTLWVGLDGSSAVREVNLTTGTAGMEFSLADNTGLYDF
ncbi:MAG: IPT/TIG domain-containing protein, partial [Acidobacteriaceae bacterium]